MKKNFETFCRHDDRGVMSPLMLVLLTGIFLTTGIALDLLRQETERSDLQNALDRGVLAAASLTQTIDAEVTVREYLANRSITDGELTVSVRTDTELNFRQITAGAEYDMNTIFLRLAGLNQLQVPAVAAAAEAAQDAEISLVLDISASMAREQSAGTNLSRLQVLRAAASNFIDIVLTESSRATTSVSLIPYAGQVNAGPLFNYFNTSRVHDYSSCVEFADSDFGTTSMPSANSLAQVPQFQYFRFEAEYDEDGDGVNGDAEWGWCPSDARPIVPFSNDANALKAGIANFSGHDGTGTQIAMKWGLGLLDPSTQPITANLVSSGIVDPAFVNRPVAFNEPGAIKVVVLMTDGSIRFQQRPKASAYDTLIERTFLAAAINYLSNDSAVLPGNPDATMSTVQSIDQDSRSDLLASLCDLAESQGVIVFTIGFDIEVTDDAYDEMRDCATDSAFFYDVDGLELDAAFEQIGGIISRLKLVM